MKKQILIIPALSLALTAGCSSSSTNNQSGNTPTTTDTTPETVQETSKPEPLDLTGLWVQEGKKEEETHMNAVIKEDGTIGVFFLLEDEETPYTYWVGTYDAPETDTKEYSWVSDNTYGGNGLLASGAENKEFTYKGDKLSYEVTIQGETSTISLIRGDWDTTKIPESAFASVKAGSVELKDLQIKDSGWIVNDSQYLYYYVDLYNPNQDIAVELPTVRITARDKDGVLLGTEDQTLSIIYPGQEFIYGFQAFSVDDQPETVEFEVMKPEDYNLKKAGGLKEYKPLEVVNAGVRTDKIVGEINNPNDYDINGVVVVLGKNAQGELTGIEFTFVDNIIAGTSTPFSISVYGDKDYAEIECYANQWGY
ncbi:MAG: hypothetical protein IKE36_11105 [Solobacterium sp.]|nr:hypothetical protein [Solobacterium sp.]